MATSVTINLAGVDFTRAETVLASHGELTASAFRYASGVAALRIGNKVGEIIVLPFQGQQIWDARFHGRRLTMGSMFDEPVDTMDYLANYGAFFLHCGATAMGNPGPGDNHPLHGELPNARYRHAELAAGSDDGGHYMELAGHYRHTIAFSQNYEAAPRLRLHGGSGRMRLDFNLRNLKQTPMDLMYLAHVNFRPIDIAQLIDTVPDDPHHTRVRTKVPEFFKPSDAHRAFVTALKTDPSLHRTMVPGRAIDPELVMGMDFRAGGDGWAHSMQLLPDGSADFISHRPSELPRGVRWITRTADQDALGLFLPGTAEADGFTAEKAKGNVIVLAPQAEFHCQLEFGALLPDEAEQLKAKCAALL